MALSAIVPAAGRSSRMNADKLALVYKDRPIWQRALDPLLAADGLREVIVVVAPGSRLPIAPSRCRVVVNADCAEGLGASLRTGVAAASPDTDGYLIALADMPEITTPLVEELVGAFNRTRRGIVVPFFEGAHGHPVILGRPYRDELLQLHGDVGARSIIHRHAEAVAHFHTDNRAVIFDVDTPAALALRRIEFRSIDALNRAAAALRAADLWHRVDEGCSAAGVVGLACYGYDEARIVALCPEGVVAD